MKNNPAFKSHYFIKGVEHKKCSKCGELKPLSEFYKNDHSSDGLQSYCNSCMAKHSKEQWVSAKNKQKSGKSDTTQPTMKKCSKCGQVKPVSEFQKNISNKDGLQSHCKECVREYNKKWHEKHKENKNTNPSDTIPDGMKKCSVCGKLKPLSEFHKNASKKSGYASACRDCENIRDKKRREQKKNLTETPAAKMEEPSFSFNKEEIRPDVPMYDNITVLDHKVKELNKSLNLLKNGAGNNANLTDIEILESLTQMRRDIVEIKALVTTFSQSEEQKKIKIASRMLDVMTQASAHWINHNKEEDQ